MSETPDGEVEAARQEIVEAFERSAEVYGLKRSYGRLYGLLFFAEEPRSLDELVEESGYAKSTVSSALRRMDRLHLVHRRSLPAEGKKAYYEAERDFWHVFQEFCRHEVMREITIMNRALESATAELEAAASDRAEHDREKLESLRTMFDRSETVVEVLTSTSFERLTSLVRRLS
jgi:DNA-binding transcriptional regulator GbsR (MarR family)